MKNYLSRNSTRNILKIIKEVLSLKKIETLKGIKKKKGDEVEFKPFVVDNSNHDWEQHNDNISF